MNTIPPNFLGLPIRFSDYARAKFAVLPIPYDSTTSFQTGTREGPAAIIRASQQVEMFDEELEGEFYKAGIATLDSLISNMAGPQAMHEDIYQAARRVVRDGKTLIGIGGEHSVTSGLVRAVMGKHKKLSILQIDAHLDLRHEWEGTPYSHASVMRRCLDLGASLVSVGIRNVSLEEHQFLRGRAGSARRNSSPPLPREDKGRSRRVGHAHQPPLPSSTNGNKGGAVEVITARQAHMEDDWVDRALNALGENVYITIDIDGFDPAYAPGTGTPEPGGLDWYQVTGLLRLAAAEKNIVGMDVVEVMPIPGQAVTEFLAARLIYKLIGYIQQRG